MLVGTMSTLVNAENVWRQKNQLANRILFSSSFIDVIVFNISSLGIPVYRVCDVHGKYDRSCLALTRIVNSRL